MALIGAALAVIGAASGPFAAHATEPDATGTERTPDPPGEESAPPRSDARLEPGPRDEGEPPEVELFPEDTLGAAAGWELRPEPAPSTTEEQSEEDLDRWMDGQLRDDAVGAGATDGWYHALGQSMRREFRPSLDDMTRDRQARMDTVQRVADELGRHAQRPQRPMDPAGVAPSTIFARTREDEAVQDSFDQRSPLYAPITWHRVEVRVTHAPDGTILAVHVLRTSGMPSMDRAAIEAVRAGATSAPRPPPRVHGERPNFVSEWAFEVGDVAPHWNVVGGVDGPTGEGMQGAALGRGVMRTSVSLLRVTDAMHPSIEERRAERRRERRERAERPER
ncbi:TonB family protein [Sandaracinus amylolyticus]|uniref:TonB family protein n=1 Tax=Sandaracinus amylolyticus TaxID=927083 RepID=UPI001F314E1B|nr:TonB family protein [Sandaracinus amylolyticus]UJR79562.1 Hypothetical protein I5071_15980 [Sandaracinus amylolyticus]